MTSRFSSPLQRAQQWLIRKSAENRDSLRLGKLQAEASAHSPLDQTKSPILFFNASTRLEGMSLNSAFSILTSLSLRWQGVSTVHWVCKGGMSHCVLGTNRDQFHQLPPCKSCIAQSKSTYRGANIIWFEYQPNPDLMKRLQGLSFEELLAFELNALPLGQIVLPSLRWILRRHHIEPTADKRYLLKEYLLSAESIYRNIDQVNNELAPKAIVVFNGQFYPEAVVRYAALKRGIRVITHEVALQPYSAFFTEGEATAYPMSIPENFSLNLTQEKELDKYLQQRFKGDFSMAGIRFWPQMHPLGEDFWERVKGYRQIVPVFTNVIFDTSQGQANVLFPDMFAWLDQILKLIRMHPETFFVIRAHPDEERPGKESRESVSQWVERNHVKTLPNVLFVGSSEYFSSYELIQKSKFVLVYNSTIGLEASILGLPVLCGGKARYTQYPTVNFPGSITEFLSEAEEMLSSDKIPAPKDYQRNARRFLYFQLFNTSLSFGDLLEKDLSWNGFVHLKDFPPQKLDPTKNPVFKVLSDGILEGKPFLMD